MTTWCDRRLLTLPVYLGFCTTEAEFEREMRAHKIPAHERGRWLGKDAGATCHEFTSDEDADISLVCMPLKDEPAYAAHARLAHEAMHVWRRVREIIGEDHPSAEFEAYAVQAICAQLFKAYDEAAAKTKVKRGRR